MLEEIKNLEIINDFPKIGLIYYEDSGDNLLRFYIEKIFKIKTGSNIKTLPNNLFRDSEKNPENNWIISTDFPMRNKDEYIPISISSVIMLVRNPIDLIMSKILKQENNINDALLKIDNLIDEWKEFYKYWIDCPIPVHIIRYEDLIYEPSEILSQLSKFLLGVKSLNNSKLEYSIKNAVGVKVDNVYLAYNVEIGNDINFLSKDNILIIQKKFHDRLSRVLSLFKYQINDDYDTLNWLIETNKSNLIKSIEMNDLFVDNNISNYFVMKIG